MPIECALLADHPQPLDICPLCYEHPFVAFMRGQVHRSSYAWWQFWGKKRAYCTVICSNCKLIVGYEDPPKEASDE